MASGVLGGGVVSEGLCDLCEKEPGESSLVFMHRHERANELVTLSIRLCLSCGDRIEKHLKRAIPKRLMSITPLAELPPP